MKFLFLLVSCLFLVACHHHGVKNDSGCRGKRGKKTCWLKSADVNQDGQISRGEFDEFKNSKMTKMDAKFKRIDANGDNVISAEERKAAYKKWKAKKRGKCKGKKGKVKKSCPFSKKSGCCQKAAQEGRDCSKCAQDKACARCGKTGEEREKCCPSAAAKE